MVVEIYFGDLSKDKQEEINEMYGREYEDYELVAILEYYPEDVEESENE